MEKFYLFFDYKFSLFKKTIGGTEWGIGWIPLGGYVKISGMIDESMDKEQMAKPAEPWEFRSKPAWQRLIIMLGGVTVNFILGILIYTMVMFTWGERLLPLENVKDGIWVTNDYGKELGFKTGDKFISMDGVQKKYWGQMVEETIYAKTITVDRDGQRVDISMPEGLTGEMSSGKDQGLFYSLRMPVSIMEVPDSSVNASSVMVGDKVVGVAGESVKYYDQFKSALEKHRSKTVPAQVMRDGQLVDINLAVSDSARAEVIVRFPRSGNFLYDLEDIGGYEIETRTFTFLEAIPAGWRVTKDKLRFYVRQFSLIFNPKSGAHKGLGGFGAIGGLFPGEWGAWEAFWTKTAFLSIILAFMNLLPIPILDGGHVMFLLYEMITGREPNQKLQEGLQLIGLVLLLGLMLYANGNDVARMIGWR